MSSRTQHHKAFTLIELLVVIAIIAILAAILFPVFAQARAKARSISCLSNWKQLGTSVQMYIQDYDESFPYWNWSESAGPLGGTCNDSRKINPGACGHFESFWVNSVYPYVKNVQVFACASDANTFTLRGISTELGWTPDNPPYGINPLLLDVKVSVGMNEPLQFGELFGIGPWYSGNTGAGYSGTTLAALDKPAQTMVLADATALSTGSPWDGNDPLYSAAPYYGWNGYPDPTNPNDPLHQCIIYPVALANSVDPYYELDNGATNCNQLPDAWENLVRHTAGENLSFADGHAKWVRDKAISLDYFKGTQP